MYILEPSMLSVWPYRPAGRGPGGEALDHCLEAVCVSQLKATVRGMLTCVEKVQSVIQHICILLLGVSTEDNERVPDEKTCMADTWSRTF